MKTDKDREELAIDIVNISAEDSNLNAVDSIYYSCNKIKAYEQPYIDRIKELEEALIEAEKEFRYHNWSNSTTGRLVSKVLNN